MLKNGALKWTPRAITVPQLFRSFYPRYLSLLTYRIPDSLSNLSITRFVPSQAKEMAKRKSSTLAQDTEATPALMHMPSFDHLLPNPAKRRASQRKQTQRIPKPTSTNPDVNMEVLDGPEALRASPDAEERDETLDVDKIEGGTATHVKSEQDTVPSLVTGGESESSLSEISEVEPPLGQNAQPTKSKQSSKTNTKSGTSHNTSSTGLSKKVENKEAQFLDPEADGDEEADEEEIQAALSRPPPVNSDYLPLPWRGRLGYVRLHLSKPHIMLMFFRPVCAHISAFRIHLCSVQELVASPQY